MLSLHGRTALLTDDLRTVLQVCMDRFSDAGTREVVTADGHRDEVCTTADIGGRVSVVPRAAPSSIAVLLRASDADARNARDGPGSIPASAQRNLTLKRRQAPADREGLHGPIA